MIEKLQEARGPVEDKKLFEMLGSDDRTVFEQAVEELCQEGKLTVSHKEPLKAKALGMMREFMAHPATKWENQRPWWMPEDERRQYAFQVSVKRGRAPTRRMLTVSD